MKRWLLKFVCIFGFVLCWLLQQSSAQTSKITKAREKIFEGGQLPVFEDVIKLLNEKNSLAEDSLKKYILLAKSCISKKASEEDMNDLVYYETYLFVKENTIENSKKQIDIILSKISNSNTSSLLRMMHLKATLLVRNGHYEDGLSMYYQLLELAEKTKTIDYIIAAKNGVGWVYMEMGNYKQAIQWFRSAMSEIKERELLMKFTVLMQNMAATFNSMHENDSALKYLLPSIELANENQDLRSQANGYAIKADILIDLNRIDEASESLVKALEIRKQIGDMFYVLSDMYQLSIFYAKVKQCDKGIKVAKEGIVLATQSGLSSKLMILYQALASNYKSCGDEQSYISELENIIRLKDSINEKVSSLALAEMSAKYNLEQKEQQIQQQEFLLEKRKYINIGSVLLLLLMLLIGFQYFRFFKQKQSVTANLAVFNAREQERNRIAAELHDNIGTQLSYISRRLDFVNENYISTNDINSSVLTDVSASARKTIADLRETIWALKKEKINLRELSDRVKVFAQKQLSDIPEMNLFFAENYESDVVFTSVDSLNIFRILQEGLNNIAQHSGANVVNLDFYSFANGSWNIQLKDDGSGFDVEVNKEDHFGLEHMEQRAKEINVIILIESSIHAGTNISLRSSDQINKFVDA